MSNEDQTKFEKLSDFFHEEESGSEGKADLVEDADFRAVKAIYEERKLVSQVAKFSPVEEAWKKVRGQLRRGNGRARFLSAFRFVSYAAAAVVVFGLFFHFGWKSLFPVHPVRPVVAEEMVSVDASADESALVSFCDGSTVYLNSGAHLEYPKRFNKNYRKVSLTGEALFNVKKDARHPFEVVLGKSKILVHGTTFNVKNGIDGNKTEVVLVKGKIEYKGLTGSVMIRPGQRIREDITSGKLKVDHVNPDLYTGWVNGKIYFEDEKLDALSKRLGKEYQVDFIFKKERLKNCRFTGIINTNRSLRYNLEIIQLTNKIKFIREEDKVTVTN